MAPDGIELQTERVRAVGARKAARPVILTVAAGEAASKGVAFYAGNDRIWLADAVPPEFITG